MCCRVMPHRWDGAPSFPSSLLTPQISLFIAAFWTCIRIIHTLIPCNTWISSLFFVTHVFHTLLSSCCSHIAHITRSCTAHVRCVHVVPPAPLQWYGDPDREAKGRRQHRMTSEGARPSYVAPQMGPSCFEPRSSHRIAWFNWKFRLTGCSCHEHMTS